MKLPIIYCHGLLGTQEEGDVLKQKFANTADWYSFNFMGHGGDESQGEWSIENFSENLITYARDKNLINPIIIGYSLGGYVALYTAMQQKIFPKQIVCYGTKWFWDVDFVMQENKKMNFQYLSEKAPHILEKWSRAHFPVPINEMLEKVTKFMHKMTQAQHWNKEWLSQVNVDIAICRGELDKLILVEDNLTMKNLLRNANLFTLPNSGHSAQSIDVNEFSTFIAQTCGMGKNDE